MDLLEGLDFTVRQCLEVENMMTSVERVISYTNLKSEPGYRLEKKPLRDWPTEGRIEVKDVSLVYYKGGPAVLRDLNLSFAPGEKIGIAGRTGAGQYQSCASLASVLYQKLNIRFTEGRKVDTASNETRPPNSEFSSSYAFGKLFVSQNRQCLRTNILAHD